MVRQRGNLTGAVHIQTFVLRDTAKGDSSTSRGRPSSLDKSVAEVDLFFAPIDVNGVPGFPAFVPLERIDAMGIVTN